MPETAAEMFARRRQEMNTLFSVTLQFRNRLFGGIPAVNMADKEGSRTIMEVWLRQRLGDKLTDEELQKEVDKTYDEVFADTEEQTTQTFKSDEGLYIEGRQIKALCKEAASRLGFSKAVKGQRPSLRQDLHEALHIDEDVIFVLRDGQRILEPDGYETACIHVMTAQGPRTAIKRSAYIEPGATVSFTARILNCVVLKEAHLVDILAFGQDLGLGAQRSQGWGKFEVIGFERLGH
jgi:hypothetical protein